jgi:hypothetical protein
MAYFVAVLASLKALAFCVVALIGPIMIIPANWLLALAIGGDVHRRWKGISLMAPLDVEPVRPRQRVRNGIARLRSVNWRQGHRQGAQHRSGPTNHDTRRQAVIPSDREQRLGLTP